MKHVFVAGLVTGDVLFFLKEDKIFFHFEAESALFPSHKISIFGQKF